jgi:peptidoglycan-associated lipoprotein
MIRQSKDLNKKGGEDLLMTRWRVSLLGPVLLVIVAFLLAGCPKRPEVEEGKPGAMGAEKVAKPAEPGKEQPVAPPGPGAQTVETPLKDIFFDFDKSVLREDAKKTLNENIQWLKANAQIRIVIEGHCDERGTNEYNLALGERRAKAVRDYLVAGGIDAKRISTISYGEERPFVLGHDESAWKFNRRAHFVATK